MKTWKLIVLAVSLVIVVIGGAVGGRWYADNRKPNFTGNVDLYVLPQMTTDEVLVQIPDNLVINHRSLLRVMRREFLDGGLQPGHYLVEKNKPSIYVARMLKFGWQSPVNLVLSGTMRLKDKIACKIGRQMMLDSAEVASALNDSAMLAHYGFTPEDVFS